MFAGQAKQGLQIKAIAPGYFKIRSTRRWSTIRDSRTGSKSGHRPAVGENVDALVSAPCS
jgi:hypothetical protein